MVIVVSLSGFFQGSLKPQAEEANIPIAITKTTTFKIIIGGSAFPVSGSLVLGLVAAALAAWMILAGRKV